MTDIDINSIKEFLTNTDEGKSLLEEFKAPLLSKRDELLETVVKTKAELEAIKRADAEKIAAAKQEQMTKENNLEAFKLFHDEEVQNYKKSLTDLQLRYAQKEAERAVIEAATKYSNKPKPLQILLKERVKPVINDGGEIELRVYGDDGKQLFHQGEPASIDQLVEMMKCEDDYKPFFTGSGVSGSGTQKSETMPTSTFKDMSSKEFNLTKTMAKTRK